MARRQSRIGLALAGGGPLGAIYEIGALCALDEVLRGVQLHRLDGYVGVSAGGFIAAALANGMTAREVCASFIENDAGSDALFRPALLLQPAWREYTKRLARLPPLAAKAAWHYAGHRSVLGALEQLGRALPTGLFGSAAMEAQLRTAFSAPGRSNDFRTLERRLVLVATDLDSGATAAFGLPGLDHVPISQAVRASAALPGLYPPVEIDGRHYVDGALKKTLHASVLLDLGVELLICLNPLVPFDNRGRTIPRLVEGGLPLVLSQTLRSLIHSRLELGMQGYRGSHPGVDVVLLEPDPLDAEMFLANLFSLSQRRRMAEHAYQRTRAMLRARRGTLAATFARHGIELDEAALDDAHRHLIAPRPHHAAPGAARRLGDVLDRLEAALAQPR